MARARSEAPRAPAATPRVPRTARPARGDPAETRARLVATAAAVFNRDGYNGTDSNAIARAAGYSPPTFYRHFPDKRAALLAAYEAWVSAEWDSVGELVRAGGSARELAKAIVAAVLAHHRRWRGLRASLRALVQHDPVVRKFYWEQRRRQLDLVVALRASRSDPPRSREADAVVLFTTERVCDAIADGEAGALGLDEEALLAMLEARVAEQLGH